MGMIFSSILMISIKDGVKVVCVFIHSFQIFAYLVFPP